jgi:Tol biopolymer transport system component
MSLAASRRTTPCLPGRPTSDIQQLTHDIPGMLGAGWSPDGKYIGFAHEGAGAAPPDIWITRSDGTGAHRLTTAPHWDSLPTWGG